MKINKFCATYKISNEVWKNMMVVIRRHLLFNNLFPKSDDMDSGFIHDILHDHNLIKRDKFGTIYVKYYTEHFFELFVHIVTRKLSSLVNRGETHEKKTTLLSSRRCQK